MKSYKYKKGDTVKIKIERNIYSAVIRCKFHNRSGECCYRLGEYYEIVRTEKEIFGEVNVGEKITQYNLRKELIDKKHGKEYKTLLKLISNVKKHKLL